MVGLGGGSVFTSGGAGGGLHLGRSGGSVHLGGGSVFLTGWLGWLGPHLGSVLTSGGSVLTSGGSVLTSGGSVLTSGGSVLTSGGSVLTSGGVGGEGANGRASTGEAVSVARTGLACFGVLLLFLLFLLFQVFVAFAVFLFGAVVTARGVFALGRAVFRCLTFVAFFFAAAVVTRRVLLIPRRVVFLFLCFASAVVLGVVRFRTFSLAVALARFFVDFRVRFAPDPSWARLFALLGGCDRRRLAACEVRRDDVFFFAIPGPL